MYLRVYSRRVSPNVYLVNNKQKAKEKLKRLIKYSEENFIRLQLTKCSIMCVNSKDSDDHEVIKHRSFNIIKYYAFLRENNHAPIHIKIKALDSCIMASLLHNCETWANCNIQQLEVKYRRMLKCILGVSQSTCSELLFVELPVLPISIQVKMRQFNFWKKVVSTLEDDDPLKVTLNEARRYELKEVIYYDNLVEKYNSAEDIKEEFIGKNKDDIRMKAEQNRSKYKTYLEINPYVRYTDNILEHQQEK